jgi:eukaryotic-like serine/threonine-protein kinase
MSYCINPNCSNRQNPDNLECCQTCGTKLLINDRYQIVKPLRAGLAYNNEVFEVKDLNERGTSKVLKSLAAKHNNSKHAELFEKEAQVLIWFSSAWQNHPGLPKVKPDGCFEVGICNGFRKLKCLVMEKIEGQNLEEWIEENQPIAQAESLNWLKQLVEILDKVHRQGLWHRDIKPSNIMLKPDGQVVLIDFGAVGVGETKIISANYTPKEQIEGQTVPQSDFFALGRTFVYLLTGRHPSTLPEERKTGRLIWRCLAPRISTSLAQLIDDLMAPLPINRPQNTQQILQRLQALDNEDESRETTPNIIASTSFDTSYEVTQIPTESLKQKRELLVKLLGVFSAALLLGLAGTIVHTALPCQFLEKFKTCGDKLSLGEKILSPKFLSREKEKGVKAFKGGEYTKAYDATRVLIEAVTRSQRKGKTVQQVLTEPNFQAVGATGVIRFQANGDRKQANIQLVTITLDQQGKPIFVPLAQAPSR